MSGVRRLTVTPDEDGMRMDRWLRSRHPALTQGRLQKWLRKGEVRLDGGRVKADQRVAAGQSVRMPPPTAADSPGAPASATKTGPERLDAAERRFAEGLVLHCDGDVLALNKPAGLAVQGGSGVSRHLDRLLPALRFGLAEPPRLTHRLDKDTSGILLLGRSRRAAQWLTRAFRERAATKTYWALTAGVPRPHRGTIDLPLAKQAGRGGERMAPVEAAAEEAAAAVTGQRAVSHYALLARAGQQAAWLAMRPLTGRTHQLRVHAEAMGCPIIGDRKYGGEAALRFGFAKGLCLHARAISLKRPGGDGGGSALSLTAPAPAAFLAVMDGFGFDPAEAESAAIDWPTENDA